MTPSQLNAFNDKNNFRFVCEIKLCDQRKELQSILSLWLGMRSKMLQNCPKVVVILFLLEIYNTIKVYICRSVYLKNMFETEFHALIK